MLAGLYFSAPQFYSLSLGPSLHPPDLIFPLPLSRVLCSLAPLCSNLYTSASLLCTPSLSLLSSALLRCLSSLPWCFLYVLLFFPLLESDLLFFPGAVLASPYHASVLITFPILSFSHLQSFQSLCFPVFNLNLVICVLLLSSPLIFYSQFTNFPLPSLPLLDSLQS